MKRWLIFLPLLLIAANEPINIDTKTHGVRPPSTSVSAPADFDFTGRTVIGIAGGGGGSGTVTSLSAGNLSPIFTTTVGTPTTTPALGFVLSTAGAHFFLGNNTGSTAAPGYVQPAFSDLAGSLSAAQFPALTGDVTTSAGSTATTIGNSKVTYAKIQNVSGNSLLLGSSATGGGAPPSEITLGTNLSMSGSTLNATGGGGGGTPGGSNTQIQYNDSTAFNGIATATYNKGTGALTLQSGGTNQNLTLGPSGTGNTNITSAPGASGRNSVAFTNTNATGSKSSQFTYYSSATPLWSFGNDSSLNAAQDFYIYDNVNNRSMLYLYDVAFPAVMLPSNALLGFGSASTGATYTLDTALYRNAAGVVEVNNGTAGTFADMKFRNLTLTGTCTGCGGGGGGTVTTTGSPVSGNLTQFSGATSITNGDLSGDVTTSGTLVTTIGNSKVTYAKMQNTSAIGVVLGRSGTAGSGGLVTELPIGTGLSWSGNTIITQAGGSNTQLQYNNGGAFGGITNVTSDGTNITISGDPVGVMFYKRAAGVNIAATGQTTIYTVPTGRTCLAQGFFQVAGAHTGTVTTHSSVRLECWNTTPATLGNMAPLLANSATSDATGDVSWTSSAANAPFVSCGAGNNVVINVTIASNYTTETADYIPELLLY